MKLFNRSKQPKPAASPVMAKPGTVEQALSANDDRLKSVQRADLIQSPEITRWLMANQHKAIVTMTGQIYAIASSLGKRQKLQVSSILTRQGIKPEYIDVSDFALTNWQQTTKPKTASEQTANIKTANTHLQHTLQRAIDAKASDLYLDINITQDSATLSFRTFGFRRHAETLTAEMGMQLARSMWAQTKTGQFEQQQPCDCSFSIDHGEKEYRIRGNSIPDIRGPSVVCRIRDPKFILPLDQCGYSAHQVDLIEKMCNAPGGLILITGETNSGKSTTLASLMQHLPTTQKIIELADPVEVIMEHVTHVELNRYHQDASQIFGRIQSAIVRQNPDTLVLGEIRDLVTAEAAMNMAIQGKRVYSTLHSQSCISSLPRLENLGVKPDLLSLKEFLVGIVSQNLVPLICADCALDAPASNPAIPEAKTLNPEGCAQCRGGIAGQTLVAEVYPLGLDRTGNAQKLISQKDYVGLEQHMKQAFEIQSKHEHALTKIIAGLIPIDLTEKIIGRFHADDFKSITTMPIKAPATIHQPESITLPAGRSNQENRYDSPLSLF